MQRFMLKSKIHRATVTDADLHYEGSISIDEQLMAAADFFPYEKVDIYDVSNGERFSTYVIPGPRGSGTLCLNGAAAHRCTAGDKVIITAFCLTDEPVERKVVLVDDQNHISGYV